MDFTTLKHWRFEKDEANVVSLAIDKARSGTNVLSEEVIEELERIVSALGDQRCNGLIIYSAKESGFIAGADIHGIARLDSIDSAETLIKKVQTLFNSIEALPFTTVALVKGFCLGGGLELALSCDYLIAVDDPATRLGLPEVLLGIHPGWGGSVRLIERCGVLTAMRLILSGKTVNAEKAYRMRIVDKHVPPRYAWRSARQLIANKPPRKKINIHKRYRIRLIRTFIAARLRSNVSSHVRPDHYPAPFAMIDVWHQYGGNRRDMLEEEGRSVARLLSSTTALNLIRVFHLQEKLKSLGKQANFSPRYVHVIGAGTMGGDIAAWCALKGMTVTLQDREPEYIAPAIKRAYQLFSRHLKKSHELTAAMDRLIPDPHGQGVRRADVLIEAIIENQNAKRSLFQSIQHQLRPDAIMASNTSSIPLDELAAGLDKPERLVGLHFFNPVAKMRLVEVVHHDKTDPSLLHAAQRFCGEIGRLPLPVKSSPGFLINRILMPYLIEAVTLLEEGEPAEKIDACARDFGMPMGPVELSDAVGLDICLSVAQILAGPLNIKVPDILRQKVEQGALGRKSGEGFYQYKNGKRKKARTHAGSISRQDITDRLILRMCSESVRCWQERIADSMDLIDAGMIFGAGFAPFRGGPLHYLETIGDEALNHRLDEMQERYGSRFDTTIHLAGLN